MKILVALKFIEEPDDLLNNALQVANKYNAKIYLLHVLQDMPHLSFYSDSYRYWVEFRDAAVKDTIRQMTKYIDTLSCEFNTIESLVVVGEPVHAILKEADRIDADLVIVENPRRNQVQDGLSSLDHQGVSRVVPSLETDDHIRLSGEEIYDLSLSFIPPLGADYDYLCHGSFSPLRDVETATSPF